MDPFQIELSRNKLKGSIMSHDTEKPKKVDYCRVPGPLWKRIRRVLPEAVAHPHGGRPAADNRAVLNGI
jgi:hypothetical protein